VVIEREEAGIYRELRREFTVELFIEVPLLPGKYRCQVIPYNFLNLAGVPSPWMYIEVVAALNPELDDIVPRFFLLDMDTDSGLESGTALYEMMVSGKNLIPGAEIFLQKPSDASIAASEHIIPGERIIPVEIQTDEDGTHVRLFFEKDQLIAGEYELIVINPGGLRASLSGITFPPAELADKSGDIGFAQFVIDKVDIFVSAAWMPSFTIFDPKEDRFFGRDISLAGAALRFGMVLAENFFDFKAGLELAVSYSFQDAAHRDAFHLWGVGLNLLVMKQLPGDKMALSFRLGIGYSIHFQANMGASFLLFVMDNWYLEAGLDYAHWFKGADTHPSSFRPWLGVGFRN
jgi:hypothetical protein